MVFGSCPYHRRPADIDIFDCCVVIRPAGDGFFKGIKIYDKQIDRQNIVLGSGCIVFRVAAEWPTNRHAHSDAAFSPDRPSFLEIR